MVCIKTHEKMIHVKKCAENAKCDKVSRIEFYIRTAKKKMFQFILANQNINLNAFDNSSDALFVQIQLCFLLARLASIFPIKQT
jgi:hypothetical protein